MQNFNHFSKGSEITQFIWIWLIRHDCKIWIKLTKLNHNRPLTTAVWKLIWFLLCIIERICSNWSWGWWSGRRFIIKLHFSPREWVIKFNDLFSEYTINPCILLILALRKIILHYVVNGSMCSTLKHQLKVLGSAGLGLSFSFLFCPVSFDSPSISR